MIELDADVHVLAIVGLILVASQLGGRAAQSVDAPRVTGYLLVGLLIGPSVLGVVSERHVDRLDVLVDVALGIIAFLIGGSLRLSRLRPLGRAIFAVTAGEAAGAFIVTTAAVAAVLPAIADLAYQGEEFWRTVVPVALVIGALSAASAPAAILAIVHEYGADGPVSRTLLGVVAIDDAVAIVLFSVMLSAADVLTGQGAFTLGDAVLGPLASIATSLLVGAVAGTLMRVSAKLFPGRETLLAVTIGMVLLVGGAAETLDGSLLLANMTFGAVVANVVRRQERLFRTVEDVEELVFGAFFVLAGAHLDLSAFITAGTLGAVLLTARFAGKLAGASLGASLAAAPRAVRRHLGWALLPQAGVAVGLVLRMRGHGIDPGTYDLVLAGVLASVLLNELITPFAVRHALRRAGEIRPTTA